MSKKVIYVRIRPYNKRTGNLVRRITLSALRKRYREDKGWYAETDPSPDLIHALLSMKNEGGLETPVFDVCESKAEALAIEKREKEAAIAKVTVRAGVDDAHVVTSKDLPSTKDTRREAARKAAKARQAEAEAQRKAEEARTAQERLEAAEAAEARKTQAAEKLAALEGNDEPESEDEDEETEGDEPDDDEFEDDELDEDDGTDDEVASG